MFQGPTPAGTLREEVMLGVECTELKADDVLALVVQSLSESLPTVCGVCGLYETKQKSNFAPAGPVFSPPLSPHLEGLDAAFLTFRCVVAIFLRVLANEPKIAGTKIVTRFCLPQWFL